MRATSAAAIVAKGRRFLASLCAAYQYTEELINSISNGVLDFPKIISFWAFVDESTFPIAPPERSGHPQFKLIERTKPGLD